jgi:hypothetical protein
MGRPRKSKETEIRKVITLLPELWAEVADYRFGNRLPSEAEAVRQLLRAGLNAEKKEAARK